MDSDPDRPDADPAIPAQPDYPPAPAGRPAEPRAGDTARPIFGPTRARAAWLATAVALVLLVLLAIFILQNGGSVAVHFLGLAGTVPLGVALFIAAVAGGAVVAIIGVARLTQLRVRAMRSDRHPPAKG